LRKRPSSVSSVSKDSVDVGDVKIAQNVFKKISQVRARKLWLHLDEKSASKEIFLNIVWIALALWIKTGKKVVIRNYNRS